jgi:hypothetical protein
VHETGEKAEEPERREQYQDNLKAPMETDGPFVDVTMQSYEEVIELLCSRDMWTN